jgi:putative Holliday junction resolvase
LSTTNLNVLAIDYGTKRIGLAYSISGIITPLSVLKNDDQFFSNLTKIISEYQIGQIFVGVSEGSFAADTQKFVRKLRSMLELPIETVEEAVSTIEAQSIYISNKKKKKDIKQQIDSLAAAVILRRVIN